MNKLFPSAAPEEVGIDSRFLINFLKRLEKQLIPMHSALIMRHGKLCMETYYKPYTRDTLHRMFSITKSFVSIGIGLLAEEGKLSLDDKIIDHFPEKLPPEGVHPYLEMLTIKDMLAMTTCHDKTTYKAAGVTDWVGSFFTVKPTHVPGTNFAYDTSSTHTLGALIEKLSGMDILSYLRVKFLDEIGFSKDAYILKDPNGVSMGGSGLCATPYDILKVIYLVANDGVWNGKQLLPADYIRSAKQMHSDPFGKQGSLEEMQGYGYQIWLTQNNGYVLFGMAGQLALYVPDKDIFMVTTADTMGRQGGVQFIYDAFWEEIYNKLPDTDVPLPSNPAAYNEFTDFCSSRSLFVIPGNTDSPIIDSINNVTYTFDDNCCDFKEMTLSIDKAALNGVLSYENASGRHEISFGLGSNVFGRFPDYDLKYAASAAFRMPDTLLIKIQIIDSAIGNLFFSLNFKDKYVTVMLRKLEETLFNEYNGVFSGVRN